MVYIDFDDVLVATSVYNWVKNGVSLVFETRDEALLYAEEIDWKDTLKNAYVINNGIAILKELDPSKHTILTRCHSYDEVYYKTLFLRENGIKLPLIPVDHRFRKCDVGIPGNNLLIDDALLNLREWRTYNGVSIYFSETGSDIDLWNETNTDFVKVKSLEFLVNKKRI